MCGIGGCGVRFISVQQAPNYQNVIPVKEVIDDSARAKFKWFFCISPEKINAALKPYGIQIKDMKQMEQLADYHARGEDKAFYGKNFSELFESINFTQAERNKSQCDTAFLI